MCAQRKIADHSFLGYLISPSQTLPDHKKHALNDDLVSLLSSITYHPEHIKNITLDLRYVCEKSDSLAQKELVVALLVRIDYDEQSSDYDYSMLASEFRGNFYNLLTLNLNPYNYRIELLNSEQVQKYLEPFPLGDIIELTRRIAQYKPFSFRKLEGKSPMTKVVDMLLRESGQCCMSVLIQPHQLTEDEIGKMQVFGYDAQLVPSNPDKELLQGVLGLQAQTKSLFSSFRMKIRLFSDKRLSQYLVNLVGSEISGQNEFFYHRWEGGDDFENEAESIKELKFHANLGKIIKLDLPEVLLDLVFLFRPAEVVSAFRLPTERISVSKERLFNTYFAPVSLLPKDGLLMGFGEHPSHQDLIPIRVLPKDRKKHTYIVGKTGTGKSMLMLGMIKQDILDNKGVCVIDPHGDLVDAVFSFIPEDRKEDVYYFDPSDPEYVMGLNFIDANADSSDTTKDYLTQEVLSMLLRSVDFDLQMFGPRAQEWTRMACASLMELPEGGTLLEVPRLFQDTKFRKSVTDRINSPLLKNWWNTNIASQSDFHISEMLGYFTSKYASLVSGPYVRNVVGQYKTTINFKEIMDEGKILLVNLSRGKIGLQNSTLLGSMVVSRLLLTAMSRAWEPEKSRRDFFMYVDEFQNFTTESFETILSEARKYGLILIIANQHLAQLRAMGRMGDKIERAIFGNVATIISFRVGTDAPSIANELGEPTDALTLRNLENRYAVTKMLVKDAPASPFTMKTSDWRYPTEEEINRGLNIKNFARKRGRPLKEVEEEIRNRYQSINNNI